jgi:hypothetical protein
VQNADLVRQKIRRARRFFAKLAQTLPNISGGISVQKGDRPTVVAAERSP